MVVEEGTGDCVFGLQRRIGKNGGLSAQLDQ